MGPGSVASVGCCYCYLLWVLPLLIGVAFVVAAPVGCCYRRCLLLLLPLTSSSLHLLPLPSLPPLQPPPSYAGENGRVSYSITGGNSGGKFSIESSSGILSCRPLDRETKESYHLVVTATDNGGDPPLGPQSASATIVVNVIDANDNDPRVIEGLGWMIGTNGMNG